MTRDMGGFPQQNEALQGCTYLARGVTPIYISANGTQLWRVPKYHHLCFLTKAPLKIRLWLLKDSVYGQTDCTSA